MNQQIILQHNGMELKPRKLHRRREFRGREVKLESITVQTISVAFLNTLHSESESLLPLLETA